MKKSEIVLAVSAKVIDIIDRVSFLRKKKNNITQVELASLMGMKPQQLNKLLRYPSSNMSLETIVRLEKALDENILVTPNQYEAYLINNADRLTKLIKAVYNNDIQDETKKKLLSNIEKFICDVHISNNVQSLLDNSGITNATNTISASPLQYEALIEASE